MNMIHIKGKGKDRAVRNRNHHTATGNYLPPGSGDFFAFTPAEAGTRFSDSGHYLLMVKPFEGSICHYRNSAFFTMPTKRTLWHKPFRIRGDQVSILCA